MADLTSRIILYSNTLFPIPINVDITATEQIYGSADSQNINIPIGETVTLYGPSSNANVSNTVYLYAQSPATNTGNINIYFIDTNNSSSFISTLLPNDFIWLPVSSYSSGIAIKANSTNGISDSNINVIWGEKVKF
jgi:hypothetical protein